MALAEEITVSSCSPNYFYFLSEPSSPKESQNLLQTTTTWLCQLRGPGQLQQQHAANGAAELSPELICPQPRPAAAALVEHTSKGSWVIDPVHRRGLSRKSISPGPQHRVQPLGPATAAASEQHLPSNPITYPL